MTHPVKMSEFTPLIIEVISGIESQSIVTAGWHILALNG